MYERENDGSMSCREELEVVSGIWFEINLLLVPRQSMNPHSPADLAWPPGRYTRFIASLLARPDWDLGFHVIGASQLPRDPTGRELGWMIHSRLQHR